MEQEKEFRQIIDVILAGAKSQPRSVLQIFRSFLNRWEIVKIRNEKNNKYEIDNPRLLALMLVIQNDYPELFLRILQFPEHFLLLYVLINAYEKKEYLGDFFSVIDFHEMNNLDVVVDPHTKEYAFDVIYVQELRRLFGAVTSFDITKDFDTNKLDMWTKRIEDHITLAQEVISQNLNRTDFLESLLSGDVVRIQNLQRKQENKAELPKIFEQHALVRLLYFLEILKESKDKKDDESNLKNILNQIEKLIIPWGIFEKLESLYKLEDLILKDSKLPIDLRMRCLYIFFKHAHRKGNDEQSIKVILRILENGAIEGYGAILERTVYLLRYIRLSSNLNEFKKAFNSFSSWNTIAQDVFVDSLVKTYESSADINLGSWGPELISETNPEYTQVKALDFIKILEKVNEKNSWPIEKYSTYFRTQIRDLQESEPETTYKITKGYFSLLQSYEGEKGVSSSDTEREILSELIAIIPFTENYKNKIQNLNDVIILQREILIEALDLQYKLQRNSNVDEWSGVWFNINEKIKIEELDPLRSLQVLSPKAVRFLEHLYKKSESWKADFSYSLRNIRDGNILGKAIMQEKMKAEAEKICQSLGL